MDLSLGLGLDFDGMCRWLRRTRDCGGRRGVAARVSEVARDRSLLRLSSRRHVVAAAGFRYGLRSWWRVWSMVVGLRCGCVGAHTHAHRKGALCSG